MDFHVQNFNPDRIDRIRRGQEKKVQRRYQKGVLVWTNQEVKEHALTERDSLNGLRMGSPVLEKISDVLHTENCPCGTMFSRMLSNSCWSKTDGGMQY